VHCPPAEALPLSWPNARRTGALSICISSARRVFYIGQSYLAYDRVWQHITDGYKARSVVGRFVLCNWPSSMRFTIELWSSQADRFAEVDHDLNAAERLLIEQHAPCFNEALNRRPTPLPERYASPSAPIRCSRSPNRLIHEAERAVQADERKAWRTV
jgi:hypothetical protein